MKKIKHKYYVNGQRILGVTSVLPSPPKELLGMQAFIDKTILGSNVHNECETFNLALIKGKKVTRAMVKKAISRYPESHTPYIQAYDKFLTEVKPKMLCAEQSFFHPKLMYCGTIDIVMKIAETLMLGDIKCVAQLTPTTRLQTSAYVRMWNANDKRKLYHRCVVHLLPTGKYRLIKYKVKDLKEDFDVFSAKLRSAQWDFENLKEDM